MPKQRVTVEVYTPAWQWCDLPSTRQKGRKTGERCRFCKEIKRRGQNPRYMCLLFNVELKQIGDAVEKTCLCMRKWKKNDIVAIDPDPTLASAPQPENSTFDLKDMRTAVQDALVKQKKITQELIDGGIPADTASKIATKQVVEEWK